MEIFKKQTLVRITQPDYIWMVVDAAQHPDNPDNFTIKYLLERKDEDGTVNQRWIEIDKVEEVK